MALQRHRAWIESGGKAGEPLSLSAKRLVRLDFLGLDLRDANFKDSDLTKANFAGADLRGADFAGATLNAANLTGATLYGAKFCDASLSRAILSGTDLRSVDIRYANLLHTDLSGIAMPEPSVRAGEVCIYFDRPHLFLREDTEEVVLLGVKAETVELPVCIKWTHLFPATLAQENDTK